MWNASGMRTLDAVLVFPVLTLLVVWAWALLDAVGTPAESFEGVGRRKGLTLALVALTSGIGGAYYLGVIRREMPTDRPRWSRGGATGGRPR